MEKRVDIFGMIKHVGGLVQLCWPIKRRCVVIDTTTSCRRTLAPGNRTVASLLRNVVDAAAPPWVAASDAFQGKPTPFSSTVLGEGF